MTPWLVSWRMGRAWATNVALFAIGVGLVMLARQFVIENDHFVLGFSGVSGWTAWLYVAAVMVVLTQPVNRWTVGFAVAFQMMTVFAEPFLSSDIYRYVWDGVVQHAHVNPYRYVPGNVALKALRVPHEDLFDNINRRDYARTIYPPVAQMVFWVVTLFSSTVTGMKVAMLGFECVAGGAIVALLRAMGRRKEEVLLYAWCPLLVWEVGGSGHVDAVVIAFVALALLFRYRERPVLTGLFLGMAVMTKFYPLVLLPALWTRRRGSFGDWKMPATVAGVVVAGYAVYLSAGKLVLGFLFGYTEEEGINSGERFFLLDLLHRVKGMSGIPIWVYMGFCAVTMGAICVWAWRVAAVERFVISPVRMEPRADGAPAFLVAGMLLAFAMMLLFSPHYPWYVLWLVPFFALAPNLPLLTYLMLLFYMLTTPLGDGTAPRMFVLNEIVYGAVAVVIVIDLLQRRWCALRWLNPMMDVETIE